MKARPNIKRLQVFSPTQANRERYAAEMAEKFGIKAVACSSPEEVYDGADIIAAVTDSAKSVLDARYIKPGQHVINIGPTGIPPRDVLDKIDVYLRFGNASAPWGLPAMQLEDEYITYSTKPRPELPLLSKEGRRGHSAALPEKMVSLAQAMAQGGSARTSDDQITYSERGNLQGQQFWAVAGKVYEEVVKQGLGQKLPLGWFTQDIRN